MNRQIWHVGILSVALLTALVVQTTRNTVIKADERIQNTDNKRPLLEQQRIPRGLILANDGTVLARSDRSGRGSRAVYTRSYPTGPLFAHAIGYSFIDQGQVGLEKYRNDELAGRDDEFESIIKELGGNRREGDDIRTTLDPRAQRVALRALGGRRGAVVALEPKTGRVRVMANVPDFDPNLVPDQLSRLNRDRNAPVLNRSTQSTYPPGSTFKVVTAAAALDSGEYRPDSIVDGSSPKEISGVPLSNCCTEGSGDFGPVTLTTALERSVNTVWAEVGEKLGSGTMVRYMKRFGFFDDPPLDYPEGQMAASGIFRKGGALVEDGFDVGRVSIGQGGEEGEIRATPLQMAMVAGAIGNDGSLMRPRLTERVVATDGRVRDRFEAREAERVMKAESAKALQQMMRGVVERGTAADAGLGSMRAAGKTGTAEVDGGTANQAWFIAFAPVDDPRVAIAVTVERTEGQGGTVAAPIARQVMQELLAN